MAVNFIGEGNRRTQRKPLNPASGLATVHDIKKTSSSLVINLSGIYLFLLFRDLFIILRKI
jgi:hypothetical protein